MNKEIQKLLQNKYVLYVVCLLAVFNIFGYLAKEQFNSATFFLVIGLLSTFFTKNMTIVLGIAMIATAFANSQNIIEGMKPKEDKEEEDEEEEEEEVEEEDQAPKKKPKKPKKSGNDDAADAPADDVEPAMRTAPDDDDDDMQEESLSRSNQEAEAESAGQCDLEKAACKANDACHWNGSACTTMELHQQSIKNKENAQKEESPSEEFPKCWTKLDSEEGATHKKGKGFYKLEECTPSSAHTCDNAKDCKAYKSIGSGFTNMKSNNIVAQTASPARVDGVDDSVGDRIDHAETSRQAMNNLQKMLGTKGISGLAKETKSLVAQQKELVNSLGQMAPVLKSAKSTLDSLNLPDMQSITKTLSMMGGK